MLVAQGKCKLLRFVCSFTPLTPSSKSESSQPFKEKCMSDAVRIGSIIIFHLSKLWKAKFFILCDVIFLARLQVGSEMVNTSYSNSGPTLGKVTSLLWSRSSSLISCINISERQSPWPCGHIRTFQWTKWNTPPPPHIFPHNLERLHCRLNSDVTAG